MSGKKTKADLVALFRLEFYRKQSNWKFCTQIVPKEKKKVSANKSKTHPIKPEQESENKEKCMNKTYRVEPDEEETSVLNEAFLETDHEKNSTTENSAPISRDCPKLSQHNITQDILSTQLESPKHDLNSTGNIDGEHHLHCDNELKHRLGKSKSIQDWVEQNITKYKGLVYNLQCQNKELKLLDNNENSPRNNQETLLNWANITTTVQNEKSQEINNNNSEPDFEKIPEPIFENWQEWKETHISSDTPRLLPQNCGDVELQSEIVWQDLPEIDKEGCEGTEAGWPSESQVWSNQKLFPDAVWSENVLRELEALSAYDLDSEPPPPAEKWVPSDKLLQWMLANKECCDDLLESSCESEDQFMRAAHCVPHSSEADLQPHLATPEGSPPPLLGAPVRALSLSALRAAARQHARALASVAHELRARERVREDRDHRSRSAHLSTTTPRYDLSCEEYPTRDIGLHQPTFIDTFITGSHKNDPNNKQLDRKICGEIDQEEPILDSGVMHLKDGRIVLREGKKMELGQSQHDQIEVSKFKMSLDWGQISLDQKQTDLNRGLQINLNLGQVTADRGQNEVSEVKMGLDWDQISLDQIRTDLNRGQQLHLELGQVTADRGQTIENRGLTKENRGLTIENQGLIMENRGQTIENRGLTKENRGLTIENQGLIMENRGQNIENRGLTKENRGLTIENEGLIMENRGQTIENRAQNINNRGQIINNPGQLAEDRLQIADQGEILRNRCQSVDSLCGYGDYNIVGRGRGRLNANQISDSIGRGRGRLKDKF